MAELVARVLQRPTKGYFSTVHVIGEVEGEVEKTFYEEFKTELGTNQFQIIPTEEPITPDLFPTWHTQSRALRKVVTFTITMADDPEYVPYLKLPENMGEYLWNTGLTEIYIVGTIREQHKCSITYQLDPFEMTISRGWREVVGINGFKVGDRLLFNTSNIYENHMFYVRSCN